MMGRPSKIAALSLALTLGALGTASLVAAASGGFRPSSVPPAGEPFGPACAELPNDGDGSFTAMAGLPAGDAAASNPQLTTLTSAIEIAGLLDTLNGDGPFTIFAPDDAAFDKIPTAVTSALRWPTWDRAPSANTSWHRSFRPARRSSKTTPR